MITFDAFYSSTVTQNQKIKGFSLTHSTTNPSMLNVQNASQIGFKNITFQGLEIPEPDYEINNIQFSGDAEKYNRDFVIDNIQFTGSKREEYKNFGGYVWGLGHHMIERVRLLVDGKDIQTIEDAGYSLHAYDYIARKGRKNKSVFQYENVTIHELAHLSASEPVLYMNLGLFFSKGGQGNSFPSG